MHATKITSFLLVLALMIAPVAAIDPDGEDGKDGDNAGFFNFGDLAGWFFDFADLGGESGISDAPGGLNIDDLIPSDTIIPTPQPSDHPAEWSTLSNKVIPRASPDNTLVYGNIYGECRDPDGPELITVVSQHSQFSLFTGNNDLKIRNLDPQHTGQHTVTLECNGVRASFQLLVGTPLRANAGPDRTVDVNEVITFDGSQSTGDIVKYEWNFGDGTTATGRTVTHAFTSLGTFTVTLTVTDNQGATASDTATVIANGRPNAVLLCPANGQVNQALTFDGRQSTDDGQITNYRFDFGDTTSTSGTNALVQKIYGSAGTFTATLTVTDDDNLTHQASCTVAITAAPANQPPTANAGADRAAQTSQQLTFDGSGSSDPDGTISTFSWNFGDGSTAIGSTVQHAFTTAGTFTVTLTVTDNQGATASDTAVVTITAPPANQPPTANAGADKTAQTNQQVTFDGSASNDPDGTITSFAWNFGDGATGTGSSVQHAFTSAGTFTVTLTVTDNNGATASDTATVTVTQPPANQAPVANAGPDKTVDVNQVVTFDGSGSSDPDGTITTFSWNFGDGSTATGRTVTHAFTSLGTFTVTLTVTDDDGATATDTAVVRANGRPTAVLICPSNGQVNQALTFDGRQSTDDGQITNYRFDFGDGTSTTGTSAMETHKYTRTGVFAATLTVTDDDNLTHQTSCTATVSKTAKAQKRPKERLVFSNINFDNEVARAGDVAELTLHLANDGAQDIENMRITLYSYDLDVKSTSGVFDLDHNEKVKKAFHLEIPEDTPKGDYDIQITVSSDGRKHETFRTITIR